MTRSRLALAIALAALLIDPSWPSAAPAGGSGVAPPSRTAQATETDAGAGLSSAERVALVVGEANPALSEQERRRIGRAVARCSERYALDSALVTAILLVESGARPWVRSAKGAVGLMQVMPYMSAPLRLAGNLTTIEANVEAGCAILAGNVHRLGEDRGVLAYFWGSEIRGVSYLRRVRAARAALERRLRS